jgi:hypothetical protein
VAWAKVDLSKYATKSSPQKLDLQLYYSDEGEEQCGKGAHMNIAIAVQPMMTDEVCTTVNCSHLLLL